MQYSSQLLFFITFGVILYGGFLYSDDSVRNYKRGLQAACFLLVAQGTLKNYDSPFIRPHQGFWRGVARFVLIYLVALVFLLFQTAEDARLLMKHLYPELGKPIHKGMHTYDDNCEFEWINIYDNMDHYYFIHCINWFLAALVVRDAYVLHFWSILDEALELSWQHILPHFRECWWDHALLDVLLSNTPAIFLGLIASRLFNLKQYDWLGRKGRKSVLDWDIFKNHRRFGQVSALLIVICANFLTGFFLINSLWIPPKNYLNLYRLGVWFLLAGLAFGECYNDIESWGTPKRVNNPVSAEFRWMTFAVSLLEVLISWKFRVGAGNTIDADWPLYVTVPWISIVSACLLFYFYLRFKADRVTLSGKPEYEVKQTELIKEEKVSKGKVKAQERSVSNSQSKAPEDKKKSKKKQN